VLLWGFVGWGMSRAGRYREASREVLLRCVCEYLCERKVSAILHNGYISVQRRRRLLNIALIGETEVMVEVSRRNFYGDLTQHGYRITSDVEVVAVGEFDLSCPNSLQGIFEFVMSKKHR
jgi:hypothetical protein